jgi:hypothetical protein
MPKGTDIATRLPAALRRMVSAAADSVLDPKQLRESLFSGEVDAIDKAEALREFAQYPWKGEKLLNVSAVKRVQLLRATLRVLEDAVRRRLQRTRRTTVSIPAGGLKAVQAAKAAAARSVDAGVLVAKGANVPVGDEQDPGGVQTPESLLASSGLRSALLPLSRPIVPGNVPAPYAPTFVDPSGADAWSLGKDVASRLRKAITTHIVRTRVDNRIALIMAKLSSAAAQHHDIDMRAVTGDLPASSQGALAATRAAVADMVAREHRKAQIEGATSWVIKRANEKDLVSSANATPAVGNDEDENTASRFLGPVATVAGAGLNVGDRLLFNIKPARITRTCFPIAPTDDGPDQSALWDLRIQLPVTVPSWSTEVAAFEIPQWPDEAEAGYAPLPLPVAPTYQPRETERVLREGALHETASTGLLPLASAQIIHDPRLAAAAESATAVTLPVGGLGPASEPLRAAWSELFMPHPSMRHLPSGAIVDPATGNSEAGPTEADASYLLHPTTAMGQPVSTLPPDAHHDVAGVRHAHTTGNGVAAAPPKIPGALTVVRPGSLPVPGPLVGSALDANGNVPTLSQVMSAQTGFSSLRAMQHGSATSLPSSPAMTTPPPQLLAHAYVPSFTRPAPDISMSSLQEWPQPLYLSSTGKQRTATDVTPLDQRIYSAALVPVTDDPWLPAQRPALLHGASPDDALSDDSESDPDTDSKGRDSPSAASGSGKRMGAKPKPAPTMQQARLLFLPKAARARGGSTDEHAAETGGSLAARPLNVEQRLNADSANPAQLKSPRDAAIIAQSVYALHASDEAMHWLEGVAVGRQAADASTAVTGGVADPRHALRMRPQ